MIRLDLDFERDREADLGLGVTVRYRAPTYAEYRAAEAAAWREVRAGLAEGAEWDGDAVAGRAEAALLDALVARCATGWDGVSLPDGSAAPLDAAHWAAFRDALPRNADRLLAAFRRPALEVAAEGNASTVSRAGAGEAARSSAPAAASTPAPPSPAPDGAGRESASATPPGP